MSLISKIISVFNRDNKTIVICGPTASGKSELAVQMGLLFDGEVLSADSRQVYRGLDIGSGKISIEEMSGVPHHMLDIADPVETYNAARFQEDGYKVLEEIWARDKLAIICGGSGLYIDAILRRVSFPNISPDQNFRKSLVKQSTEELFQKLESQDPRRAQNVDKNNRVRIVRALEILNKMNHVPEQKIAEIPAMWIGLDFPDAELRNRIYQRLLHRLDEQDMVREVRDLIMAGLPYERLSELGLEYKYIAQYVQKLISRDELIEKLFSEIWQFARRQRTWFRKNERIEWFHPMLGQSEIADKIKKWI